MTGGDRTRARRETVAPAPSFIGAGGAVAEGHRRLAADAFEAMIENAIMRPEDLFDLDGDTLLRRRNGCIETFDADVLGTDLSYP